MKRRFKTSLLISIVLIFVGIVGIIFLCDSGDDKDVFGEEISPKKKQLLNRIGKIAQICGQRVLFHGIVLDQHNLPVEGAKVEYVLMNFENFLRISASKGTKKRFLKTDENGRFSISGIGGSLSCFVSHLDYYRTDESTHLRGEAQREKRLSHEDFNNPVVFRLHKKGICEPLYYSCSEVLGKGNSSIKIPEEGIVINLANGRIKETATSIYISHKSENKQQGEMNHDWECTLRIPGGGFRERSGDFKFISPSSMVTGYLKCGESFSFIAPEGGYREEVKIGPAKDETSRKREKTCHYFVKFPNGLYGTLEIQVSDSGWMSFQALINPNPNSRNLEYDYKMQVNKHQVPGNYYGSF